MARYGLALVLCLLATLLAFLVRHLLAAPNLTLIYVLPVVISATLYGWGPSLFSVVLGVGLFDFFFTQPYFSLRIANASDIWAAALLLVVAAIVTSVAAESRRRALEANRAADQAQALQALAHVVIEDRPESEILRAAAAALHRIFAAPTAVFVERAGRLEVAATAGGARIAASDEDAARGALASHLAARGETYPYERTFFDLWPVSTPTGCRIVLAVDFAHAQEERPAAPERFTDVVGAYLAAAFATA